MSLPLIPPDRISFDQRPLYDDMRKGIWANFKGLATIVAGQRPADLTREEAVAYDNADSVGDGWISPVRIITVALDDSTGRHQLRPGQKQYCQSDPE